MLCCFGVLSTFVASAICMVMICSPLILARFGRCSILHPTQRSIHPNPTHTQCMYSTTVLICLRRVISGRFARCCCWVKSDWVLWAASHPPTFPLYSRVNGRRARLRGVCLVCQGNHQDEPRHMRAKRFVHTHTHTYLCISQIKCISQIFLCAFLWVCYRLCKPYFNVFKICILLWLWKELGVPGQPPRRDAINGVNVLHLSLPSILYFEFCILYFSFHLFSSDNFCSVDQIFPMVTELASG